MLSRNPAVLRSLVPYFRKPENEPQDENTRINPLNIYAVTKVSGLHLCRMYRAVHQVFASVGMLL